MNASTTSITIIREPSTGTPPQSSLISIPADRWQLAKTRWRATAADGREFGFELAQPLQDGDAVWSNDYGVYVVRQIPEDVLVVHHQADLAAMALAWEIGNLHQPVQITAHEMITADDPSLRQFFAQKHVAYSQDKRVFQPVRTMTSHHHH